MFANELWHGKAIPVLFSTPVIHCNDNSQHNVTSMNVLKMMIAFMLQMYTAGTLASVSVVVVLLTNMASQLCFCGTSSVRGNICLLTAF